MQGSTVTSGARVCVPVCVRGAEELRPSIERAASVADIVELRLDCLEANQLDAARAQLGALLNAAGRPFIITFRPEEQGGGRRVSLDERPSGATRPCGCAVRPGGNVPS
jgi:3-dehydroquinate dehydratase